jgi:hypothetical protein
LVFRSALDNAAGTSADANTLSGNGIIERDSL